jgi:ABC-2 type transport system permease protein
VLGVIAVIVLGAAFFSTFSVIIASLLRTRDRVVGIGQLLTMPLFFASTRSIPSRSCRRGCKRSRSSIH